MRLFFLTNFYPPFSQGGYEQWCQEVTEGLRDRGNEVIVLTSRPDRNQVETPEPKWICRDLHLEMEFASLRNSIRFFTSRKTREKENLARLRQLIEDFRPDRILIWGMWNLSRSLPALAEKLNPGRVAYYMGDYWPTLPSQYEFYWQAPARHWVAAGPKYLLGSIARRMLVQEEQPALRFAHVMLPTAFMCDELERKGVSLQETKIVYGAIDTSLYTPHNRSSKMLEDGPLSLLYAGRLTPDKGVHTAIEALGKLIHQRGINNLKLTIVGVGDPTYETYLRHLVQQEDVDSFVTFLGAQPKEAMPTLYNQADIFLFTSIWQEPFGRVLVEAMASGAAVVGTATGGAKEIMIENENALVFPPGDAASLATQIARLVESPSLLQRLAKTGRQIALEKFDIHRMTEEIEAYLEAMVNEQ
jgi:glycogen(starch) synthase